MIAKTKQAFRRSKRARARARHRRTEGIALLVIMIIIVTTTAAAAISVQNTNAEVEAAGRERMLMHARYAAEAALNATLAWLDQIGNSGSFLNVWNSWAAMQPPEVREYSGGHPINNDNSRHMAARTMQGTQSLLNPVIEPVGGPDPTLPIPDLTGSFGPNQPYSMQNYVVDLTDCFLAPSTISSGAPVGAGVTGLKAQQFYCSLTVRGRIVINDVDGDGLTNGAGVTWANLGVGGALPAGTGYQERSGAAHDTRATILTPAILVPNN